MKTCDLWVGLAVLTVFAGAGVGRLQSADGPVRLAIADFRQDRQEAFGDSPYAGFTTVVQAMLDGDQYLLVEREDVKGALAEATLAKFGVTQRDPIKSGQWLNADILITGLFRGEAADAPAKKPVRIMGGIENLPPPKPDRQLVLKAVDLRRGAGLGVRVLEFPDEISPSTGGAAQAPKVVEAVSALIEEAISRRAGLAGRKLVAPLYMFRSRDLDSPLLDRIEDEFLGYLRTACRGGNYGLLELDAMGEAIGESELVLLGVVDADPAAWQQVADVFVFGEMKLSGASYLIEVTVWNGRGEPIKLTESIPGGLPDDLTIWPTDPATGQKLPADAPVAVDYQRRRSAILERIPAREIGLALRRISERAVEVIPRLDREKAIVDIRSRIAKEYVAPAVESEAFLQNRMANRMSEKDKALGLSFMRYPSGRTREQIRRGEVAMFLDPANQAVQEELLKQIDYQRRARSHRDVVTAFETSYRWGRHVDRFGLQTTVGRGTSLQSGFKLEPYLWRWAAVWRELESYTGRTIEVHGPRLSMFGYWQVDNTPSWMLKPEVLAYVRAELLKRLRVSLDYLTRGTTAVGISRAAGPRMPRTKFVNERLLPYLVKTIIDPVNGLVSAAEHPRFNEQLARVRFASSRRPGPPPGYPKQVGSPAPANDYARRLKLRSKVAGMARSCKPSDRYPSGPFLNWKIPAADLPELKVRVEEIAIPGRPDAQATPQVEKDQAGNLWLLFEAGDSSDGRRLGRLQSGTDRIEVFKTPPVMRFAVYKNEPWLIGDGFGRLNTRDNSFLKLGLVNDFPVTRPEHAAVGDGTLYVFGDSRLVASSSPTNDWGYVDLPKGSRGAPAAVGGALLIQASERYVRPPGRTNWLRLDGRLRGHFERSRFPYLPATGDRNGLWLGSDLGLFHYDYRTDGLRHWPLAGKDCGVPARQARLIGTSAMFPRRFGAWIEQRLHLLRLADERHPKGESPVRPSPIQKHVVALHLDGDWLWIGCHDEVLLYHVPSDSWGGRVSLGGLPVHTLLTTPEWLWVVHRTPKLVRLRKTDVIAQAKRVGLLADGELVGNWLADLAKLPVRDQLLARFYRGEFAEVLPGLKPDVKDLGIEEVAALRLLGELDQASALPGGEASNLPQWWELMAGELVESHRVMMQAAGKLSAEKLEGLDRDGDDRLSSTEVAVLRHDYEFVSSLLREKAPISRLTDRIFELYDADKSGALSIGEFCQYYVDEYESNDRSGNHRNEGLGSTFSVQDLNLDESISREEFSERSPYPALGLPPKPSGLSSGSP